MLRAIVQTLKILTIAAMALLVAAGGFRVFDFAVERARPADAGQRVEITVGDGDTGDVVADRLRDAGLIRSKFLFTTQLRLSGRGLEAGTYTLRKGMTVQQIVDRITGVKIPADDTGGDGGEATTFKITIREGWRTEQIAEEYEKLGGEGGYEAFMKAVRELDVGAYEFLADRPDGASLEGYLFPDTYDFRSDNPSYNIQLMLDNFNKKVTPEMRNRAAEMGLTLHQVLTLASLVEKEAQVHAERPIIADVYLKRWVDPEWRLEADPTVQYALGKRGDWWPKLSGDDLHVDSPYNTYQIDDLPPGPICNPGLSSIQAVLTPAETPYYFFVAKGDSGEHAFAATKEEHDANVERYLNGGR